MDPLLEQFLQEARENLAFIDQNIEDIGSEDPELLNSVFRAAHTLKGGSGIVGFDSVKDITHYAEDLLDMLRAGKLEFQESMTASLYDAFDEVMNLVEAAEESGEIVDADEETVSNIINELNNQMGKSLEEELGWEVPFSLVNNTQDVINLPLSTLRGVSSVKIPFKRAELTEEYCSNENLYAVLFDVDESCMVYGNDPIYTLSLLEEKVLGVYSCMSDDNAKCVLSGTEDEEGLLLKSQLIAYIYATYEDIENSLFNFIDELQLLPLDISTLLSVNVGDTGHQIDLLKEFSYIANESDVASVVTKIEKSMELVGTDTIQYTQLQRFLNISGFITDSDISKLSYFFSGLYKGEVYNPNEIPELYEENIPEEITKEEKSNEIVEKSSDSEVTIDMSESVKATLKNIMTQQYKALDEVTTDDDLNRVAYIMQKIKRYIPEIPAEFNSKDDIYKCLETQLGLSSEAIKNTTSTEKITVEEKIEAPIELKKETVAEKVEIKQEPASETTKAIVLPKKEMIKQEVDTSKDENKKAVVGKTVKIEQKSIDSLMNVVGELLVAKNSLPYLADNVVGMTHDMIKREIMEKYIFINRLSEQLQDLIMGMRMLPISYVFDRYPKLVRDISKKLGKKVKLEMDGGETKLDKNMIEMLADPMIHIMRNSLDHGIELPDVREQKGKNPSGTVTLKAYAQSDRIIIEIKDDGAGINVERVANKVLEKGLMTHEQIDALNEEEMAELVLLPGLSTAEEISEYSGRGVGMDVVKKSIEGFGGNINIKTKANQGTVITLAIPVSLAVTSLLHIQMNDIHYGIPMDSVSETVKLEREDIEYLHNEPFIYIRGEVIPLLFIKSMLNEKVMENEPLSIVVLNIKDNLLAVVVNKFLGQLDVVQKPLVGIMENHPLFSGTALLGNGQIIMAIDPLGLLGISQKLKKEIEVA